MKRLSASKLEQAEKCGLSLVLPGVVDVHPYPYRERGKVLHQFLCDVAMRGYAEALKAVPEEYRAEASTVDLSSLPHSTPDAWAVEVAFAYNVDTDTARELHRGGSRDYSSLDRACEVPGTADVVGITPDEVVVLDVKTGLAQLEAPGDAPQLLFLALAACRAYNRQAATVGWIRLRDGVPYYSSHRFDVLGLNTLVRERVERIITGVRLAEVQWEMAPETVQPVIGPHCKRCDAFFRCPAQANLAREVTRAALGESALPLEVPEERRPDFFRWVRAIGVLHEKLEAHLEEMARAKPIDVDDLHTYGPAQRVVELVNATIANEVLRNVAPDVAELAVVEERKLVATKASIAEAVKKRLPSGETQKGYVTKLLKAIREAGGAYAVESTTVRLYKKKPPLPKAPELPSGEAEPDVPM